jgi:hypothetical protein
VTQEDVIKWQALLPSRARWRSSNHRKIHNLIVHSSMLDRRTEAIGGFSDTDQEAHKK